MQTAQEWWTLPSLHYHSVFRHALVLAVLHTVRKVCPVAIHNIAN